MKAAGRATVLVLLLATSALVGGDFDPARATLRPGGPLVPSEGALLGVYTSTTDRWLGNARHQADVQKAERSIGRRFAIDQHYYSWSDRFPSGLEEDDAAAGRLSLITWQPDTSTLDRIITGEEDAVIDQRARALRDFGRPVFLRFGHEMNGNWSAWDGTHSNDPATTDGPGKFVRAWRYVHERFQVAGASAVVWVWSPNARDHPDEAWNHWTNYYPGDDVVDWVGIDGYNWGLASGAPRWTRFGDLISGIYADYAGRKPIMVAETAAAGNGADKAAWISDLAEQTQSRFPAIAAVVWFDQVKEADWTFGATPATHEAFRRMASGSYFAVMPSVEDLSSR